MVTVAHFGFIVIDMWDGERGRWVTEEERKSERICPFFPFKLGFVLTIMTRANIKAHKHNHTDILEYM